jgi:3',5'-cyclic AMP phosphodiesterase CpdA
VNEVVVAHLSDIHCGSRSDLPQLAVLERFLPTLAPQVIVVSGDVTQRARHGEFQCVLRLLDGLAAIAPVHLVPGNHDVQWWRSPFGLLGRRALHQKWRHYFGENLTPVLERDGIVVAGMLSANGVAWGSLTLNPNDMAVKGNLPRSEVDRVRAIFAAAPTDAVRLAVLHHNVLPGVISRRWGLSRPLAAQRALLSLDADVILCGHDHTEGAGQIDGRLAVSTAGTHSVRTRGGRPSAFNLLRIDARRIQIDHYVYARADGTFRLGDSSQFVRHRGAAPALAR